jgi:hypothetical protein
MADNSAIGAKTAPWAGVAFAILMGASLVIIDNAPGVRASDEAITHYYSGSRDRPLEATVLYLLPLAGVCFLWFVAVLRYRLRLLEGSRLGLIATVQFASGIVFLALLFTAGAGFGAGIATELISTQQPDAASLREVIALSDALLFIYATRASAIFVLSTSMVGLRTGTLPRPLGWIGLLVALALLLASVLSFWFVLVFPAWVLIVSVEQLRRRLTGAAEISGKLRVR